MGRSSASTCRTKEMTMRDSRLSERLHLWLGFLIGGLVGSLAPLPWWGVLGIATVILLSIVYMTVKDTYDD